MPRREPRPEAASGADETPPLLEPKAHDERSVFTPASLLREARRQRRLPESVVPVGTSVRMVDLTYGHLVSGSELDARRRLDEWVKNVPRDHVAQSE